MATATELPINTSATALDMANEIFGSGMVVNSATYSGDVASSGTYSNGDIVPQSQHPVIRALSFRQATQSILQTATALQIPTNLA